MKPKNLKEFKALIRRYESITLKEIKKISEVCFEPSKPLTGFGYQDTCTLCLKVKEDCNYCVYGESDDYTFYGCNSDENKETYDRIEEACTPLELKNAYRARAKHMKILLNSTS